MAHKTGDRALTYTNECALGCTRLQLDEDNCTHVHEYIHSVFNDTVALEATDCRGFYGYEMCAVYDADEQVHHIS